MLPDPLPAPNKAGLTVLDAASGGCWGRESRLPLPVSHAGVESIRAAVVEINDDISDKRRFLAFSGGTDSSMVLAIATNAARAKGISDPVPITIRYPEVEGSIDPWQERVVSHLGLQDWIRLEIRDEFDVVGPHAQTVLRRDGVTFPASAYIVEPQAEIAAGEALVLPIGASDFYSWWHWSGLMDVLAGRRRPRRTDAPHAALAAMPRSARRRVLRKRLVGAVPPWLTPEAREAVTALMSEQAADIPLSFAAAIPEQRTHRCFSVADAGLRAIAAAHDVTAVVPAQDPRMQSALVAAGGRRGPGSRQELARKFFDDQLPWDEKRKHRKPNVKEVFYGPHCRAFGQAWSGGGLEHLPVLTEVLAEQWRAGRFDPRSAALLQVAWLHDNVRSSTGARVGAPLAP